MNPPKNLHENSHLMLSNCHKFAKKNDDSKHIFLKVISSHFGGFNCGVDMLCLKFKQSDLIDGSKLKYIRNNIISNPCSIIGEILNHNIYYVYLTRIVDNCPENKYNEFNQRLYKAIKKLFEEVTQNRHLYDKCIDEMSVIDQCLEFYDNQIMNDSKSVQCDNSLDSVQCQDELK